MIMLGDEVVEIELEGLAALQGIPLHELPPDKYKARRAIGDAVNRTMATVMLAPAVQYVSEYMIGCGIMRDVKLPTTTVTETLEQTPAATTNETKEAETTHIEPTGITRELDGPWTAEETGEVDAQHRRQPTNSISVSQTSVPPTENWQGYEYREILQRANKAHMTT